MSEFQNGYKKAIEDLKGILAMDKVEKISKTFLVEILNGMVYASEEKKNVQPVIYFTKLDEKGNLKADRDATIYYAEHPKAKKPAQPPKLKTISQGKEFDETIKSLTDGKTIEKCKEENEALLDSQLRVDKDIDPIYLNALLQQMVFLAKSPKTLESMLNDCCIPNENMPMGKALQSILDYMTSGPWLFSFSKD